MQYDFITSQINKDTLTEDAAFKELYDATLQDFEMQLNKMFPLEANTVYDTTLPSLEDIVGKPDFASMTKEQQMEFLDLQTIIQETLDDAQISLNELAKRALLIESNLLKINKPKIILLILNALNMGYQVGARVGRAAYCTYSHIPQLNASLNTLYEGVDCYLYTTSLIVRIQNETYQTFKTVKKNIFELATVYKKVAEKNSLMGKIVSAILSVTKVAKSISETISTAKYVLDDVENHLPVAAKEVLNCGSNVAVQIPHVIQTVSNVTECILFVDDTKTDYDFMKPESEYNNLTSYIHTLPQENESD